MSAGKRKINPNLLFVFSDQHRWCDLGCYGNAAVRTPRLDEFARKALRFEHCISNSPLCVPARGSMLTGLLPMRHRAAANDLAIDTGAESIAHVFAQAGYRTGYIGKWHLAGVPRIRPVPRGKERLGFEEWKISPVGTAHSRSMYFDEDDRRHPIEGYEPVKQTDLAIEFIERNRYRPWALCLSWGPPHDPYDDVPDAYKELYADVEIPLRPNVPERIDAGRGVVLSREQIAGHLRGYYAHITALDEQFGRLLDALEESGQRQNTIIVYTSDHGDMLGSQGFMNKQLPYEESVKVPLLVHWDGVTYAGTTEELISLVDLPVSLAGLAGLRFRSPRDGADLSRLFTDPKAEGASACYIMDLIPCHQAAWRGGREWQGVRTREYTFARSAGREGWLLFHNTIDPYQQRNLVGDPRYASVLAELQELLRKFSRGHAPLVPWERLVRESGLLGEWNRSQQYFGLPTLE